MPGELKTDSCNCNCKASHGKKQQTDIVITGMSGRLPESDSLDEFKMHLMNHDDMVTDDERRWPKGLLGTPSRSGKLKDLTKFDASFFGVHPKQANTMDPQLRLLMEVTYEAILDAGVNPESVRGSKTGVFIGCSASESHEGWCNDVENVVGYEMTGCTRSMFANRLSFFFDFKGPSFAIDTACSSSLLALDQALHAMREGSCDAAIVGGCSLCLKPSTTLQFLKLGMLSPDGACKSFDITGNGYCRSEAVVVVYLQKSTDAKRIYATVINSRSNTDGSKEQGITFPSGAMQKRLLEQVYNEAGIDPAQVAYVEAHGTGTKAGDPQEVNSVVDVFCKSTRKTPLLIGSTKSNMGHPEPASGLAAVAKVLLSMEGGVIPANLHYSKPNPDIPALADGRLKVVSENTPWEGGYVGVNSFGFGGSNVHVLLRSNHTHAANGNGVDSTTAAESKRLVTVSGRTEEGVKAQLDAASNGDRGLEMLLHDIGSVSPATHSYRGYAVTGASKPVQEIARCGEGSRPLWYVFAGMGTQWHGMARDLMSLDIFRQSIMKCDRALQPLGLKLYELIMTGDDKTFEDSLNSFICIAAIQVALVDVLRAMGLQQDGVVGHSVGELGCAYADGCLTAEETVLAAYWRGRCVLDGNLPPGGMAAVGLTWEESKARCPPGVLPACHNAEDTVTISGPAAAVSAFVKELQAEGIFAKDVNSAGVAFHSSYMAQIAPSLQTALAKIIPVARPRSSQWISSSIPEAQWHEALAQSGSAEYWVNNLVSPVLFQEALQHVPRNAVVIEIAPHCLLQAILKRSLGTGCCIVGLMKRGVADGVEFFLSSLGKVHNASINFNIASVLPSGEQSFPVPRGTPMISPLVKWDHSLSWDVPSFDKFMVSGGNACASVFKVALGPDSKDQHLAGHVIDGRVLFPATGYLTLAWRALAKQKGILQEELPVSFTDCCIHRATILPPAGEVTFEVSLYSGSDRFEVSEGGSVVVSGRISASDDSLPSMAEQCVTGEGDAGITLTCEDVYKELRLRGYEYGPTFQGIIEATNRGDRGRLAWNGDWVSFLDTMLQLQILSEPSRALRLPTRIRSLTVHPGRHLAAVGPGDKPAGIPVVFDRDLDLCVCGGVELSGLHATVAPRRTGQQAAPVVEDYVYVPYTEDNLSVNNSDLVSYCKDCESFSRQAISALLDNGIADKVPNKDFLRKCYLSGNGDKVSQNGTDKLSSLQSDGQSWLKSLQEAFCVAHNDEFVNNARNVLVDKHAHQQDKLIDNLLCGRHLKTCLDVVIENTLTSTLRVAEINASSNCLFTRVSDQLARQPALNVDICAIDKTAGRLDEALVDDYGLTTATWDLASAPPSDVGVYDLVVASNLHEQGDLNQALRSIASITKDGGFVLIHDVTHHFGVVAAAFALTHDLAEFTDLASRSVGPYCDVDQWQKLVRLAGLEVVARKSDGLLSTLFLCRKVPTPAVSHQPRIINVSNLDCSWVDEVKAALSSDNALERVWLLAELTSLCGAVGLANCLRHESGGERVRCLCVENLATHNGGAPVEQWPEFSTLQCTDLLMNVYQHSTWGSFKHVFRDSLTTLKDTPYAYVNVLSRGDLSTLKWIESPLTHYHSEDHPQRELCSVHYTSLNFRDIMLATGKLPPDAIPGGLEKEECLLGMEFSGVDTTGRRVMGLLPAKGLATAVDVDKRFLWPVPEGWSLEQAATVPVVYTTVYYALVVRGRIRRGDRVLIHSGSGGVGQAAIAVALHHGCEVFTTVGSADKRDFLRRIFPQLDDAHIANSRDISFETQIRRVTKGRGVDVVLNSLSEDKLQASVRLLAQHGRFLEIGKYDLSNDSPLGMAVFLRNITFHGVLLDALFDDNNPDWDVVSRLLEEGIRSGAVRPLPATVFGSSAVEEAFRYMAQGKHIGKVLIKVQPEDKVTEVKVKAVARSACDPHKAYIVAGGLGGFGLELCAWLVERGARHLVLVSRSGVTTGYQSRRVREWRESGVKVTVSSRDVTKRDDVVALLSEPGCEIGGVFNLAMVLADGMMENQTVDSFRRVCQPKVQATATLDAVTRQLDVCRHMQWFVAFSSVSCGRGNAGQANYGFANSVMERICEQRQRDGLPGLAVQWGAIGDVGIVVQTWGTGDVSVGGTLPQKITSCLHVLDSFLCQSHPVVSSLVLAEKSKKRKTDGGDKPDVVNAVMHVLGVKDVKVVGDGVTLGELGLDSLMGVEIKQLLERDYAVALSAKEIRALTVAGLRSIGSPSASKQPQPSQQGQGQSSGAKATGPAVDASVALVPKMGLVPMNDLAAAGSGASKGNALFVVHPIEGTVDALRPLMGRVTCGVYGLQCTADAPLDSVSALASHYIQRMQTIQPSGPYRLCGYSFGACVAMEMAAQVEQRGEVVSELLLLDGSHAYVAAHTHQHTKRMAGDTCQAETEALCAFMLALGTPLDYVKVASEMREAASWDDRVTLAVQRVLAVNKAWSADELKVAAVTFYRKLVMADAYKLTHKLACPTVTLVKAGQSTAQHSVLGADYGLAEVCAGHVDIHVVDGDHKSFLLGDKVAAVVNSKMAAALTTTNGHHSNGVNGH